MQDDCKCPVHRDGNPPTYPLGFPFTEKLHIESIPRHIAADIYNSHHSYMPDTPTVNLKHHGLFLDGNLTGAITYRHPLMQSMDGIPGGKIVEVARICVAVDMPNLASAALAESQDKFIKSYCSQNGIERLVTYIREDYHGSMISALKGKGWESHGLREAGQASNRPEKEIREWDKERWVCDLDMQTTEQTKLSV